MAYDLIFFAEKRNGHKHSSLTGTVLVIAAKPTPDMFNGICVAAVAVPKGQPTAVPCRTWVLPSHLAKRCVQVTEAQARAIQPSMFDAIERHERSAAYRAMHAIEVARAFASGRYTMQPADEAVLSILCPSRPVEVEDDRGFVHE